MAFRSLKNGREGVQVNILYDCVGTAGTPKAFFTRMADAGIRLCAFHPVNPLRRLGRWRINHRDHRKILVVDGRIGFTGGANISSHAVRHSRCMRLSPERRGPCFTPPPPAAAPRCGAPAPGGSAAHRHPGCGCVSGPAAARRSGHGSK